MPAAIRVRLLERGRVADGSGIEDDDVGGITFLDQPALARSGNARAGSDVIFRTASSSGSTCRCRTYSPSTRGVVAVAARVRHAVARRRAVRCRTRIATYGCRMIRIDVVVGHEVIDHRRAAAEHQLARRLELRVGRCPIRCSLAATCFIVRPLQRRVRRRVTRRRRRTNR